MDKIPELIDKSVLVMDNIRRLIDKAVLIIDNIGGLMDNPAVNSQLLISTAGVSINKERSCIKASRLSINRGCLPITRKSKRCPKPFSDTFFT